MVKASIVLTQSPEEFNQIHLTTFKPQEALDLVHAIALFAWANRLMLNLGEPLSITSQK
jgi:alkylhydroperoxidase family enzyme